jgi:hypothetical protein
MIPRNTKPPAKPTTSPQDRPDNAPPTFRQYTDLDFCYGPKHTLAVTLTDQDALIEDPAEFRILYANGELCRIFRAGLCWMSRRERTVTIPAKLYIPSPDPSPDTR